MPRWLKILLALAFGLIAGLFYGWVISPVQYTDSAPNSLAPKYRAEYILMVAEAYQSEKDPVLATHRLALLGDENPAEIIQKELNGNGYAQEEKELLEELLEEINSLGF